MSLHLAKCHFDFRVFYAAVSAIFMLMFIVSKALEGQDKLHYGFKIRKDINIFFKS